jgi:recombinational DNA repair ATPase RecF
MIKEKKNRIKTVNELDEKFQKIYDNIKKDLLRFKDSYTDIISQLKQYIQQNINMKMKIQLEEEKNKQNLEKVF